MIQPEPQSTGLNSLITDITSGRIKIPQFQREYVWEMKAAAQLLDSIAKGFPIWDLHHVGDTRRITINSKHRQS